MQFKSTETVKQVDKEQSFFEENLKEISEILKKYNVSQAWFNFNAWPPRIYIDFNENHNQVGITKSLQLFYNEQNQGFYLRISDAEFKDNSCTEFLSPTQGSNSTNVDYSYNNVPSYNNHIEGTNIEGILNDVSAQLYYGIEFLK